MSQNSDNLGYTFERFLETHQRWYHIKQPPVDPFRLVAKLAEELGEVSEAVLANSGSVKKTAKLAAKGITPSQALQEELGDLLISMANLCRGTGVSVGGLEDIMERASKKMESASGGAFGER